MTIFIGKTATGLADLGSATWSTLVDYSISTSIMTINHQGKYLSITNHTFSVFLRANTAGKKEVSRELVFNFVYPYLNPAPTFSGGNKTITVDITGAEQLSGLAQPTFTYLSEVPTDIDSDPINLITTIIDIFPCNCAIIIKNSDNSFTLEIDKKKITLADKGNHLISITLTDNKFAVSN